MQHNKRGQIEAAGVNSAFLVSSYKLDTIRKGTEMGFLA